MKKDWTYKKLGEVCDILNGYAFKSNKYVDKGIRVIRIANVQKGIIVDDQPAFYPLSTQSEIDKYILNEGDILMSLTGNVGRVGILQKEMLPAALNQRVACLRMSDNSLYSKFFFHYLDSDLFEQKCIASARGIAQLNMSTEWLKEQFIPIPPLSIQRSIVAELDLLHSVISKKKEQLRELDNLAQSLFYQMFGDPITNPMGWEIKKLGEVCVKITDGSHNPPKGVNFSTYRMLSSQNIFNGYIDYDAGVRYLSKENYAIEDKRTNLQVGDVLMTIVGTIGRTCIVSSHDTNVTLQRSVAVLRPNNAIISKYLSYFIMSINSVLNREAHGIAQKGIYLKQLSNFTIPLPPLSLQQSFAAKVSAIEAQKQAVQQSIREVEALLAERMDNYFS